MKRLVVLLPPTAVVVFVVGACGGDIETRDVLVREWVEKYGGDVTCVDQALSDLSQREARGLLRGVREEPTGLIISVELGDAMSDAFECGR